MKASMKKHGFKRAVTAVLLGTSVAAVSGSVTAVENDALQIETIVVTAQRRAENVQEVPISVTAFTAEKLEKMGAVNLEDISRNTPGLNFNFTDSKKQSQPTMRGVSSTTFTAGADPAIGIYVDEVYMGGPAGSAIDLFDIERVEVLRGPQGTLFGRNTTGGVINVTSKRPTKDLEGYMQGEFGDWGHKRVKGSISGPLVPDVLSGSISAFTFDRNGFLWDEFLHRAVNDTHEKGVRGSLLYAPTTTSEWFASFDYSKVNQTAKGMETLKNYPENAPALADAGALLNTDPWDRTVFNNFAGIEKSEAQGLSLRGRVSFDHFDLISVTGYRKLAYYSEGDTDRTPLSAITDGDPEKLNRFTQEVRLESTGKKPLSWIVGAYYYNQRSENDSPIFLGSDLAPLLGVPDGTKYGSHATVRSTSSSLFGNVGYKFTDRFEANIGGRYTSEKKSIDFAQTDNPDIPGGIIGGSSTFTGSKKYDNFTPAINARYRFAKDLMAYATYSEGFKGGGYVEGLRSAAAKIEYGPEFVKNTEIGIKSRWLENRVQFNAALFRLKWTDMQLQQDDATTSNYDPIISNAGKATSKGAEFELTARVTKALTIGTNLALLDAKFTSGPYMGKDLLRSPKQTFGLNAEYRIFSNDSYDITVRGDAVRQSVIWLQVRDNALGANDPMARQEAYTLVNGRLTFAQANDKWRFSLWGKNLTDRKYITAVFDLASNPFVGQYFHALGAPRTLGVDVRYNF